MVRFFPTDKVPTTYIVEPLLIVNFPDIVAFPLTCYRDASYIQCAITINRIIDFVTMFADLGSPCIKRFYVLVLVAYYSYYSSFCFYGNVPEK